MKFYFLLQFKMINRQMTEFGMRPVIAYPIILAVFLAFSFLLFTKAIYAGYIYLLVAIMTIARLSETRRNDFLKTCFPKNHYLPARIIENNLIVIPFILFLIYKLQFALSLILVATATVLALMSISNKSGFTIPTPFGKRPFEFTVGFRNTYLLIFLAYFLVIMSITADNFNLGIAALIMIFLVCFSFYFNPENEFYVWIHNLSPRRFLFHKIITAFYYSTYMSLPVIITLMILYPDKIPVIAMFQGLGYVFLSAVILAKYAFYPHQVNLPQFIILAVSAWFPPLLIAAIPFFYIRSVNRLKELLA